jgi:hypothetical protein
VSSVALSGNKISYSISKAKYWTMGNVLNNETRSNGAYIEGGFKNFAFEMLDLSFEN